MEHKNLGNSDLRISPLGVGAWAMGGAGWEFAWGDQNDADSVAAIHAAIDAGMNWIDTAAVYGLGHSEGVVGRALKQILRRPYVFTKCGLPWNERHSIYRSLRAGSIRNECENSLRRLQIDVIDLYQIHWPDPDNDIEEGWTEMARLKEQGKVRWIGVSNFNTGQMERAMRIAPITSLQPPYSLLKREVEKEILPFAKQNNIGVIVYSPMGSGLLTGKMTKERVRNLPQDDWRRRDADFEEPRLSRNLELVEILRKIADRRGCTPAEIALAWTLHNPAVTGAIVGLRRAGQVKGVAGAMSLRLTEAEISEIEAFLGGEHESPQAASA